MVRSSLSGLVSLVALIIQTSASPISNSPPDQKVVPSADLTIDPYDLSNLIPQQTIALKYAGPSDQSGSLLLSVEAETTQPVLVLENSAYVQEVICSAAKDSLSLLVKDGSARDTLYEILSRNSDHGIILITNSDSCNTASERGFYQSEGIIAQESLQGTTFVMQVEPRKIQDFTTTLKVNYVSLAEPANQADDLRRRTNKPSSSSCNLVKSTKSNGLQCHIRGVVTRPQKAVLRKKAMTFDDCRNTCIQDSKCMSFGWMGTSDTRKGCWTSSVSLAKQKPSPNNVSPWVLYDRGCWKCNPTSTSVSKSAGPCVTTIYTTQYTTICPFSTSTGYATAKPSSSPHTSTLKTTVASTKTTTTRRWSTTSKTSSNVRTSSTSKRGSTDCTSSPSISTPSTRRQSSTTTSGSNPLSSILSTTAAGGNKASTSLSASTSFSTTHSSASSTSSSGTTSSTPSNISARVSTTSTSLQSSTPTSTSTSSKTTSLVSSSTSSTSLTSTSTASKITTPSSASSSSSTSNTSSVSIASTTSTSSVPSSSTSHPSSTSTSSTVSTTTRSTTNSGSGNSGTTTTSASSTIPTITTSPTVTITTSGSSSTDTDNGSSSDFDTQSTDSYYSSDSSYFSSYSQPPPKQTYDPNSALASYTSLLAKVKYVGTNVQAMYIQPTATPQPTQAGTIDDQFVAQLVAEDLYSAGLQGPYQALTAIVAAASFAPVNIPTTPPPDGQDELGSGVILPDSLTRRSVEVSPVLHDTASHENARLSSRNIAASSPLLAASDLASRNQSFAKRDFIDGLCNVIGDVDQACSFFEQTGLAEEEEEICGTVGIASNICDLSGLNELVQSVFCFFGLCSTSSPTVVTPPPPPPPIDWSYDQKFSFQWSLPANTQIYEDAFGAGNPIVYCVQCSYDLKNVEFSGTVIIDSTSKAVIDGYTTINEKSVRWAVLGLTTTGASVGSTIINVNINSLGSISADSLFSITPSMSISIGLSWNVKEPVTNMITAGSEIAVLSSSTYVNFAKSVASGGGQPTMRTVRPDMGPTDSMQMYSGTSISLNINSLGGNFHSFTSTNQEHTLDFSNKVNAQCVGGVAKQAFVDVLGTASISGTNSQTVSISRQLADICGLLGNAGAAPNSCFNGGTTYTVFNVANVLPADNGDWSPLLNDMSQLYEVTPRYSGSTPDIGRLKVDLYGYYWPTYNEGTALPIYHNGPYRSQIVDTSVIVNQGYLVAEVDGPHTFTFTNLLPNQLAVLFWGPAGQFGIDNLQHGTESISGAPPGQWSSTINMTKGQYYAIRILVGFDATMQNAIPQSNPHDGAGFPYDQETWQVAYPNGTVWQSANVQNSPSLVQYSCDGTSGPPFSWADF